MAGMLIRQAETTDAAAIEGCVRAAYGMYVPRMGIEPAPMLADYARLVERAEVYVLVDSATILGVLVMRPQRDHLFIENVAVAPEHQGKGYGSRLLRFAEDTARAQRLPELRLYTHQLMTENQVYYPRLGYEEYDRRTEDGYDRVYFRKRLQ